MVYALVHSVSKQRCRDAALSKLDTSLLLASKLCRWGSWNSLLNKHLCFLEFVQLQFLYNEFDLHSSPIRSDMIKLRLSSINILEVLCGDNEWAADLVAKLRHWRKFSTRIIFNSEKTQSAHLMLQFNHWGNSAPIHKPRLSKTFISLELPVSEKARKDAPKMLGISSKGN